MRFDTVARVPDESGWAVILAGGEGARLRPLTRALAGDDRPKQFCAVIGDETLLQQTIRRVGRLVPPERRKVVLTRTHERFFTAMEATAIVQPESRGTTPAILYSLLSIANADPCAKVALFPADHHFSNDATFIEHVAAAFRAVTKQPELVILLGIAPTGPEIDYGWIHPGERVSSVLDKPLFRVQRFWEKPTLDVAERLLLEGCLWNTLVLVGSVPKLVRLVRGAVPDLYHQFAAVQPAIGTPAEDLAMRGVYANLHASDFSREVLSARPKALTVLPVHDANWVDVGTADRVFGVLSGQEMHA